MLLPSLLFLASLAAGDIYRCADGAGTLTFSDLPCGTGADMLEGGAEDRAALRSWLESLQAATVPPPPDGNPARSRPAAVEPTLEPSLARLRLPPRPAGQRALASCSAAFLECTGSDAGAMDRCIAAIVACPGTGAACCDGAYLRRYRDLRQAGADRQTAVRVALLGHGNDAAARTGAR